MDISKIIQSQRTYFQNGRTLSIDYREKMLLLLENEIVSREYEISQALKNDLNKSSCESYMTEIGMALSEIRYVRKNLKKWAKKKYVKTPIAQFAAISYTVEEPYGVTLVMAPWNYPFLLSVGPLIGAIAAGNCCILKPSEYAPNTSHLLYRIIHEIYPENYIAVIEGDVEVSSELLKHKFDYIFYTGGVNVGKIVMKKASKYLTPVTLELGGKSPTIVDKSANIMLAAKRIVFGKFLNAGQTCVAPDYVLVQEDVKEELLKCMKKWILKMYPDHEQARKNYAKIINQKHYDRILSLLNGEKITIGGVGNARTMQIAPTILEDVSPSSPVMQEEIFGPVLPVLTYKSLKEAIKFIQERPKPLALYLFTQNKEVEDMVTKRVSYGGGCINDTIIHLATPYMGFGGVGNSGMGNYHGIESFRTFSHKKSIVKKYNWLDISMRYAPYTKMKEDLIRAFLK